MHLLAKGRGEVLLITAQAAICGAVLSIAAAMFGCLQLPPQLFLLLWNIIFVQSGVWPTPKRPESQMLHID